MQTIPSGRRLFQSKRDCGSERTLLILQITRLIFRFQTAAPGSSRAGPAILRRWITKLKGFLAIPRPIPNSRSFPQETDDENGQMFVAYCPTFQLGWLGLLQLRASLKNPRKRTKRRDFRRAERSTKEDLGCFASKPNRFLDVRDPAGDDESRCFQPSIHLPTAGIETLLRLESSCLCVCRRDSFESLEISVLAGLLRKWMEYLRLRYRLFTGKL